MKLYLGFVFFEVVGHELWLVVDRQHDFLDSDLVDFMVNQMNAQKTNVKVNEPLRVKCQFCSLSNSTQSSVNQKVEEMWGVAQHTNLDEGFDLVEDHGLVREFNKGLGHRERERTQARSEAANEDEGLHIER
jgi:hypothetical protein